MTLRPCSFHNPFAIDCRHRQSVHINTLIKFLSIKETSLDGVTIENTAFKSIDGLEETRRLETQVTRTNMDLKYLPVVQTVD